MKLLIRIIISVALMAGLIIFGKEIAGFFGINYGDYSNVWLTLTGLLLLLFIFVPLVKGGGGDNNDNNSGGIGIMTDGHAGIKLGSGVGIDLSDSSVGSIM